MTVGPDYVAPDIELPDEWTSSITTDQGQAFTGSQRWWQKFNDPTLHHLIAEAREANPNLKIAYSRIIEGWHQRHVLSAAWYPKSEFSGEDRYGILDYDNNKINWNFNDSHEQLAKLEVGWELDLFGRVKRQVEAAESEYQSKIEGMRDIGVFIYSEVALHYIALRTLEGRVTVAKESVSIFKSVKDTIKSQLETGLSSELDLHEVEAREKISEAEVIRLEAEKIVVRNRLASLLAKQPKDIQKWLSKNKRIPTPPHKISIGIPANLLRSRPDIRRAERKIAAQSARIGIATAQLYPQLAISGALGYEFYRQGSTVETLTRNLGIGPTLRWRILNASADKHKIKENEAIFDQTIHNYRAVVINAVTEVENALTRLEHSRKRLAKLDSAVMSYKKAANLMIESYDTGEIDLKRLLNGQRDYIFNKDEAYATKGRVAANAVRLFKALGGGELPSPSAKEPLQPTDSAEFPADQFLKLRSRQPE